MNTIPLIFNERQIDRTVLGGSRINANAKMNISVIMLNSSGSQFRIQTIEKLLNCGFKSIVSFEPDSDNFNIEDISHRFPLFSPQSPSYRTSLFYQGCLQ